MPELATQLHPTLVGISNLFDALHENDIRYCHWKSNEHLAASMLADTDLDILFDEKQKGKIEFLLKELEFKRFDSVEQKRYKDIVDFLGFDVTSGRVIHLHTHYRLTVGEPYLKGYQLNWEEQILNNRVWDESFGIYCADPAFEFILLYVREALKLRHRDALLMLFKKNFKDYNNALREYHWLKTRTTDSEVYEILNTIFNRPAAIYRLITTNFSYANLHRLVPILKSELAAQRLYSPLNALLLRWYRESSTVISKRLAYLLHLPILSKRVNPRGGVVVAVIGADGSGKSTIVANLRKTFEIKLDVFTIYFGRGDGKISWSRRQLQTIKKFFYPNGGAIHITRTGSKSRVGIIRAIYKCMNALLVAREKNKNLNLMQAAKKKGMLVICDRYPQNQIMEFNDGPLLATFKNSENRFLKALAKLESKIYARADQTSPDIVFKLIADAEVVEKRKPGETSLQKLRAKISGIRQLRFDNTCKVIEVDTTKPVHQVLSLVKKEIWNIL